MNRRSLCLLLVFGVALVCGLAYAQTSSLLYRRPSDAMYTTKELSLVRVPLPTPLQKHDLITIMVDEKIVQQTNARTNRLRNTQYQVSFNDLLVLLSGLRLRADQQVRDERPKIDVKAINNLQTTSTFTRNDRLTFPIQASVAEVKPNGNLVIEANGQVAVNNEVNTYSISGIVSPLDVDLRARTVPSSKVADKRCTLTQVGPTRDSIKRGWFVRFLDMFAFF